MVLINRKKLSLMSVLCQAELDTGMQYIVSMVSSWKSPMSRRMDRHRVFAWQPQTSFCHSTYEHSDLPNPHGDSNSLPVHRRARSPSKEKEVKSVTVWEYYQAAQKWFFFDIAPCHLLDFYVVILPISLQFLMLFCFIFYSSLAVLCMILFMLSYYLILIVFVIKDSGLILDETCCHPVAVKPKPPSRNFYSFPV
jgi:hypothetical protein